MRVLIIFPGALGDLICLGPALRAITRRHAGAPVELMARGELARFAVGRMSIARGHSIDRREVATLFRTEAETDPAATAFFGQFGRIYSFFAADDSGFNRGLRAATTGSVSTHPFRPPGPGHISRLYLDSIDAEATELESSLELSEADLDSARSVLGQIHAAPGKFLLILPGSGSAAKNWPLENFMELCTEISRRLKPVALLGPAENEMKPRFLRSNIAILEAVSLEEAAAVARLAAGFAGNDSGMSHLSAAAGTAGTVIFGPSDPSRWKPLGDVRVIRHEPLAGLPVSEVMKIVTTCLVP